MRPPFNSFQPQGLPHRPQKQHQNNGYSNHHQHNGYHNNPMEANNLRMMNPHMMNNPMMGHMNNPMPMPNMPMHPQFFNNLPNMPQQQLHQFAMPNHINQLLPNLLGNLQFAVANSNLMGHSLPLVQPNFFQPSLDPSAFTSQPQLNSFNPRPYPPLPNHQSHPPGFSEPRPRGQTGGIVDSTNGSGFKGNDFRNNFTKHQKFKGPGQGFQRPQLHQADNGKRKSGFNKDHKGKGNYNKMTIGFNESDAGDIANEKKRSFALVYTPKEIKQWREARRKNYPTKRNAAKKVKKNVSDSILDEEAKMRRQQLQEILAKQAELGVEVAEVPSHYLSNELGVEVAEVPSHYLSNTDGPVNGDRGNNNGENQYKDGQKGRRFQKNRLNGYRGNNNGEIQSKDGQKGRRFQKNRQKRRRHDRKDKSGKKTICEVKNSPQESSMMKREPTLLEKLLSADIKREKSQLLQVIRFMVMNSFFEEFPEQPLNLPLITVEETGCEHDREDEVSLCDDLGDDDDDDDVDVVVDGDDNSCDEDVD